VIFAACWGWDAPKQAFAKIATPRNHLFAAICGYAQLQRLHAMELISNGYRLRRDLFNKVIAAFIGTFMPSMAHLNPQFQSGINA
jgi:hypothetical protein